MTTVNAMNVNKIKIFKYNKYTNPTQLLMSKNVLNGNNITNNRLDKIIEINENIVNSTTIFLNISKYAAEYKQIKPNSFILNDKLL